MKKRLLSALCAVMLLICAVPMASAQTGDAARRADALTVLHLLSEDPSRDLTKPATRAQAAVLLVRLAGGEKKPDTDGWFAGFRDVPDWARTAVNYANRRGWISGVSNVQFDPNGHLNADAWCAMLLRMLGYSDKTGDFEISDAAAFAWRIGLTGRQLTGILSVGDLAEAIYDALDFCYKGTETTVLSHLMDLGVCTASAANALGLLNKDDYQFLWVTEFPMFEYSEEEGRYVAMHHPFTSPKLSDVDKLLSDPGHTYARAYDIVLNGVELGGGSIRISDPEIQQRMFEAIGLTDEQAQERFGFLLNAFKYGVPPHGGMAYGLDRLVMLMLGKDSIKEVIAFPKVQNASDLMTDCPSPVDQKDLDVLHIRVQDDK